MRIAYCTTLRLPSDRSRSYQAAKVVEALQENGHSVEIFTYWADDGQAAASSYGLSAPLRFQRLGATSVRSGFRFLPERLRHALTLAAFRRRLTTILRSRKHEFDLLYTTAPELVPALARTGLPVLLELRQTPKRLSRRFVRMLRSCRIIVALTSQLRQSLVDAGMTDVPVIVESDGVDPRDFETAPAREQTRASLSVSGDASLITFAGRLTIEKHSRGIPELIAALEILRQRGVNFRAVIAGGPADQAKRYESSVPEKLRPFLSFPGSIDRLQVPSLLSASDVLLLPAPASDDRFFVESFSPLQLFEYLMSGCPVATVDLPPIRDIVDEKLVTFFPPGNVEALARTIRSVLDDRDGAEKKAQLARAHVLQFSWQRRMERVIGAVSG